VLKGQLGEVQIYFRKTLLHQQKFLVLSVLSNSPWLPKNLKNVQMKLLSSYQLATLSADVSVATVQASNFLHLLRDDMN